MHNFFLKFYHIRQCEYLRRAILGCVLLTAFVSAATAQEITAAQNSSNTAQRHSLQELLREALDNNPQIQAAQSRSFAAKNRVPQASSLPDPMAGYSYMGEMMETRLGPQEEIYEFEQEIPFPGKLIQKRKMARADVDAAQANFTMIKNGILLQVAQTYYELLAVKESLATLDEIQSLVMNLESAAQSRYVTGRGLQREISQFQIERSKILKETLDLRQQDKSLSAMLSALLNTKEVIEINGDLEADLPVMDDDPEKLLAIAFESRPELLEAKAMTRREQHARHLAGYENAPDFKIGFQYTQIGNGMTAGPDAGRDAWMIPIKITLPIWRNRIDSAVAEANNNLAASRASLEAEENATVYEVKNAFHQWTAKRQIVDLYRYSLLPQAEIALRSAEAGYKAGEASMTEFFDSARMYLESRIVYYRVLAEANTSFAALQRVLGKNLNEVNDYEK